MDIDQSVKFKQCTGTERKKIKLSTSVAKATKLHLLLESGGA